MIHFLGYPNFTVKYIINQTVKGLGLGIKYIDNTITKKLASFQALLSQQQIDPILIAVKKVLNSIPPTTNFQGLHRNKGPGDGLIRFNLRSSSL